MDTSPLQYFSFILILVHPFIFMMKTEEIVKLLNRLGMNNCSASFEDEFYISVTIISDRFENIPYAVRFREIDTLIKSNLPEIHKEHLFNYLAQTEQEAIRYAYNAPSK